MQGRERFRCWFCSILDLFADQGIRFTNIIIILSPGGAAAVAAAAAGQTQVHCAMAGRADAARSRHGQSKPPICRGAAAAGVTASLRMQPAAGVHELMGVQSARWELC